MHVFEERLFCSVVTAQFRRCVRVFDVHPKLTCTMQRWCVLNSAVHQSCVYSQPIIRSLSQASHSSLCPCFAHPSTYFHLPQKSPTNACCCVCWWIIQIFWITELQIRNVRFLVFFYAQDSSKYLQTRAPWKLCDCIKRTTGKRENLCFDMRVTQSNKNINYWDLVSLAHKNTVYLNSHVIWVFFKAHKYAERTFLKRGKKFCLEKGGWSMSLLLDWT